MKAAIFAILGTICYALANVLLEYKFAKYNNLTIIVFYSGTVALAAVSMRFFAKTTDPSFDFPIGIDLWLMLGLGLIFFVADYFFIGAYTSGGDVLTITCLTLLFPIFASIFKILGTFVLPGMTYPLPNLWQISGYILGAISILLVVKGGLEQ